MMRRFHTPLAAVLCIALATGSVTTTAVAQDKAMAVQLFEEAKKLMDQGKYAEACPKLEASTRADPTADGAVLRLAACYQGLGRFASAWGRYKESLVRAEKAKRQDRIELAKKGIAETEPKISRLTISVPPASRVNGLEVRLDGSTVDAGAWGSAVPLDPGAHNVEASAPGFQAWSGTVTLGAVADSKSLEVPKLTEEPKPAPVMPPATAPTSTSTAPARDVPQPSPSPVAGYVAIGAGVLFIGGGVFAYTRAKSARDDYFADCSNQTLLTCDNDAGRSKVRSWETISYVSLGVGVVAAGIGIVLLTTGGSGEKHAATTVRAAPMVGSSTGGLMLSGAF